VGPDASAGSGLNFSMGWRARSLLRRAPSAGVWLPGSTIGGHLGHQGGKNSSVSHRSKDYYNDCRSSLSTQEKRSNDNCTKKHVRSEKSIVVNVASLRDLCSAMNRAACCPRRSRCGGQMTAMCLLNYVQCAKRKYWWAIPLRAEYPTFLAVGL